MLDQSARADAPMAGGNARELELKLELDPACDQALLSHPLLSDHIGDAQQSVSVYYDTKEKCLRDAGITLRVRKTGDRFVQTVKAAGKAAAGLFERGEWEVPIAGPDPDLDRIATGHGQLDSPEVRDGLRPIFQTLVDRRAVVIDHHDARIELVVDRGEVIAGKRRQPIYEVELELIEGSPSALFDVARELQTRVPLQLGVMSKSERGERLANGKGKRALKAEPVKLSAEMTANEAFRVIAFSCLRHFRANEPLVVSARDPDALHQSRVALRRLRSAFSLFKPILKGPPLDRFREGIRDLAGALGRARNLDVLLKHNSRHLSRDSRKRLLEERTRAYDNAIVALRSPCTSAMMIDLAEWIALGERRRLGKASRPIILFADKVLDRFWKKVKHLGRHLRHLEDDERHELRIAGKKLRYAGEFFSALYADEAHCNGRDGFLAELESLQDGLGGLNDIATQKTMEAELTELGISLPAVDHKRIRVQQRELVDKSAQAFERLDALDIYWRD
jgi:triphosphatase